MRNRTFHFLGACTVAAVTAAFAMACADIPPFDNALRTPRRRSGGGAAPAGRGATA
jgi:hypothetical protein